MLSSVELRLTRLDAALASLTNHLQRFTFEQLTTAPAPGAWSAIQVVQHLMAAERASLQYVKKKTSYPAQLRKGGWKVFFRRWVLQLFLQAPFKFKAPDVVSDDKFSPVASLEQALSEWRTIRSELRDFLQNLPEDISRMEVYRHLVAGRLDVDGMLQFFEGHLTRHRKQIDRTLKAVSAST